MSFEAYPIYWYLLLAFVFIVGSCLFFRARDEEQKPED
jgi:hypothetical protein